MWQLALGKGGTRKGGWPLIIAMGLEFKLEMLQGTSKEQTARRHLLGAGKDPSGKVGMSCGTETEGLQRKPSREVGQDLKATTRGSGWEGLDEM